MDADCFGRLRGRAKPYTANRWSGQFVRRPDGGSISTADERSRIQSRFTEEGITCSTEICGVGEPFGSRDFGGNARTVNRERVDEAAKCGTSSRPDQKDYGLSPFEITSRRTAQSGFL